MIRSEIKDLINTNLEDFSNIVPEKHREVANMFLKAYPYPGELKDIMMPTASITIYFDTSGLGRVDKEYEGWAIRNGNNGTDDAGGLVDIGYKPVDYPALGATGGNKDAVVVEHTHTYDKMTAPQVSDQTLGGGSTPYYTPSSGATASAGVSGVGKNMQPYRVVLKLMSL